MLSSNDVTACLVTRGDQPEMMERILASLIFPNVIVWDNSVRADVKTSGRYAASGLADTRYVYFQDDDVIVPESTQKTLLREFMSDTPTVVYAHGDNDGGYGDVPLVGAGAIMDKRMPWQAARRYLHEHSEPAPFFYYCDFAIGVLYPRFKQILAPFEIQMDIAQHESRLCNQPWAADMKADVTRRARAIRDGVPVPA